MSDQEHQELLVYLEEFLRIAEKEMVRFCKKGESLIDVFMRYPYLKLCNDTFVELLNDHTIIGL